MRTTRNTLSRDQLKVLTSPVRQEIVDLLHASGPMSVAEIADGLGRPADSLYFHMRKLAKAEILEQAETRRLSHRDEAVFALRHPLDLSANFEQKENRPLVVEMVAALLRLTQRDFEKAAHADDIVLRGPKRNLWGSRMKAWLTEKQLREVRDCFDRIDRIMARSQRSENSSLYTITFVATPPANERQNPQRS